MPIDVNEYIKRSAAKSMALTGADLSLAVAEDLKSLGHNLKEWTTQTDATVAIRGTSGRGHPRAVGRLKLYHFEGLLERRPYRNGHQFRAVTDLVTWAAQFENPYPYPLEVR